MREVNLKLWTVCNYQVAIPWINTSGNTETLGCKFNTDLWWWENKGSLWGASRSYRPQPRFALTWFYFSQELSPSARKRLPWQDPQRLDSPFIWLWFTRPSDGGFWWGGEACPSAVDSPLFTTNNKHIDPQRQLEIPLFWKMCSSDMTDDSLLEHMMPQTCLSEEQQHSRPP